MQQKIENIEFKIDNGAKKNVVVNSNNSVLPYLLEIACNKRNVETKNLHIASRYSRRGTRFIGSCYKAEFSSAVAGIGGVGTWVLQTPGISITQRNTSTTAMKDMIENGNHSINAFSISSKIFIKKAFGPDGVYSVKKEKNTDMLMKVLSCKEERTENGRF